VGADADVPFSCMLFSRDMLARGSACKRPQKQFPCALAQTLTVPPFSRWTRESRARKLIARLPGVLKLGKGSCQIEFGGWLATPVSLSLWKNDRVIRLPSSDMCLIAERGTGSTAAIVDRLIK
jgi:hypothetical protein